jgi:DNA segregation ATPase FtsK/SpoIIIE, S-DNA-T family
LIGLILTFQVARNSLKNSESAPETPADSGRRRSSKSASPGRFGQLSAFFADERVKRIIGVFLILFSVFSFLACFSYLFTGDHDLRLVMSDSPTPGLSAQEPYKNWAGKMGAHVAWFFMNKYFGIGALFLPLVLFLTGVRSAFSRDLLPYWKTIRLSILGMLYFPLAIGFLFHHRVDQFDRVIEISCNQNLVGGYGHIATEWTTFTLGWMGTLLLLLFGLGAFLIFNFNHQVDFAFARMAEWWRARKTAADDDDEEDEPAPVKAAAPTAVAANTVTVAANVLREKEKESDMAEDPEEEAEEEDIPEPVLVQRSPEPEANETDDDTREEETEEEGLDEEEGLPKEPEVAWEPVNAAPWEEPVEVIAAGSAALSPEELENLGMEIEAPAEESQLSDAEIEQKLQEFGPYDPRLDLSRYELPPVDMLKNHGSGPLKINTEELEENKNRIIATLNNYKIEIAKIKATIGPTVTLYEIVPAPGVRISKIKSLEDDIALSLSALGIRIIAPIPGKGTIGIEVPNSKPDIVSMRSLIASEKFQLAEMELPVVLGKTIQNEFFVTDLAKMPHLLMAGATGQGKSVGLNAILVSLLYKKHPSQIKFVLVDPKKVELTLFNKIERHFLAKLPGEDEAIITDTQKVVRTLQSLCIEMDNRYELLKNAQCRNIKEYNAKFIDRRLNPENGHRYLPYIVLVVDEFADLIMTAGREVETPIARLAQLARAIGIHLIIATQRPSVNIITGVIKANFPARIAFRVTSKIDSRTILDAGGADQLIGRGDMLFSTGNDLTRIQCGFVDTPEVEAITDFIGSQQAYPSALLLPEVVDENTMEVGNFAESDRDELFEEAARMVVISQQGSASLLQRKLKLGYNRAGRLVDQLEAAGVIGPFEGSKARKVLIPDEIALEQFLKNTIHKEQF